MGDSRKWLHWGENKNVICHTSFLYILKAKNLNFQIPKGFPNPICRCRDMAGQSWPILSFFYGQNLHFDLLPIKI